MSYYPDIAIFSEFSGGGIDNETGYPIEGVESMVILKGRYDANINDFLKKVADAQSFVPSFVFYMPLTQPNISVNTILKVTDNSSGIEFTGKVQMFNKGKFNAYALCSNT